MRIDDPEYQRKLEMLRAVNYAYSNQEDARLRWLELEVARLAQVLAAVQQRLWRLTRPEPDDDRPAA